KKALKVGTFNLLNLVSQGLPYYEREGYDKDTYEKKINWIARQIDRMEVDIIGFQEVFHEAALDDVLKRTKKLKDAHVKVAAENGRLPRVAIASRFPIQSSEVFEAFPSVIEMEGQQIPISDFSRPILKSLVQVEEDLTFCIYVVHLKSKRPLFERKESRKDPVDLAKGQIRALIRRGAESAALREVLMKDLMFRSHPVILLGDVNDNGLSVTSRTISGEPPHKRYPKEVKKKIWDVLLYHVKDIQARRSYHDHYFTHIHNGFHEALDHIMVSQELVKENPKSIGSVSYVHLFNDHLIDETLSKDKPNLWQSDHGQVVASLNLRGNREKD
ncbi:MAG: endonuclease/exonuclease/phosphatase family protein, partial [Bacteroidota bacterium]